MKKVKHLTGAFAITAIVGVNVWNATTSLQDFGLNITDVEALANPEQYGTYSTSPQLSISLPRGSQGENHFETTTVDEDGVEYFKVICAPAYSAYETCNPIGNEFWLPTGNVVSNK